MSKGWSVSCAVSTTDRTVMTDGEIRKNGLRKKDSVIKTGKQEIVYFKKQKSREELQSGSEYLLKSERSEEVSSV